MVAVINAIAVRRIRTLIASPGGGNRKRRGQKSENASSYLRQVLDRPAATGTLRPATDGVYLNAEIAPEIVSLAAVANGLSESMVAGA
jgi:hypothetical protein